jgi:glycosyltransferase involved in cell wall biosynthesis
MLCYFFQPDLGFQENHLVREYLEAGHQVLVIAPPDKDVFSYYEGFRDHTRAVVEIQVTDGYTLVRLPYRRFSTNKVDPLKGVYSQLTRFNPDLIFVHGISFNLGECVKYAKNNSQCDVIVDFHGDFSNSGRSWISRKVLHGFIKKWYLQRFLDEVVRIYAITPASIEFVRTAYGVDSEKIELLPLGADLRGVELANKQDARSECRKSLGLRDSDTLIFTGGKLEPWKKTDLLIEAILELNRSDLHVVIAGVVPDTLRDYQERLNNLAIKSANIHFVGWVDPFDLTSFMLASDLAVFPASQSVIWQQAVASGLPLIIGELPHQGVAYMNRGNILPLDASNLNSTQLAIAILALISDPSQLQRMGEISSNVARTELDWVKIALQSLKTGS